MKRLLTFAALPLLWTAPARAEGWNCSVRDELGATVPAMIETIVAADGSQTRLDFYIYHAQQRGYIATQQMAWIGIPSEATLLWKPDRYEFGIPGPTDERGYIRFDSLQGLGPPLSALQPSMRSLRPNFDMIWVKIEDAYVIAHLWAMPPQRVDYTDRSGQPIGSLELQLPGRVEAQALFTRMRAKLARRVADPATYCRALPDTPTDETDQAI